jgi:cytochrome c2
MILNGDRTLTHEGVTGTPWQIIEQKVHEEFDEGLIPQLPQQPQVEQLPFFQQLNPQEQQGVRIILQYGCGGCHTIPNIPGASGNIGPNLGPTGDLPPVSQRTAIAGGAVPNTSPADLAAWIADPPSLKPGTAMPKLGLTPDQAAAAAAYLYSIQP